MRWERWGDDDRAVWGLDEDGGILASVHRHRDGEGWVALLSGEDEPRGIGFTGRTTGRPTEVPGGPWPTADEAQAAAERALETPRSGRVDDRPS